MNHRDLITALTPRYGGGEARAIVRLLMEDRFGLSQTDLLLGKDRPFFLSHQEEIEKCLLLLLEGVPVQYVLGFTDFCGHRFKVSPDVLIPRPETEELVAWAVAEMKADMQRLPTENLHTAAAGGAVWDLCTGSGCIAVSLALEFPANPVLAVDVSEGALAIARQNAKDLGAGNVCFQCADVLEPCFVPSVHQAVPGTCPSVGPSVSLLISNPPYVCLSEAAEMESHVLDHEPSLALFVPDEDPLCFYRAISQIGQKYLVAGGRLFVEINAALADPTRSLFVEDGYTGVSVHNDQFNRPRMLCAKKE
ncbi:MAG: peptide chain release factor N(5)-glutamine methyltransferase [Bacteroidales bacterium]|nr:peptide chain release factor N(5)-glutamine methyltransferase [Bacteroidales bacterium]